MHEILTHNLGLKLISFLIAVTIWFKVSFANPAAPITYVYYRPVSVIHKDPTLKLIDPDPNSSGPIENRLVAVHVTARRVDLLWLESQIKVVLDLKNVRSPIGEVTLSPEVLLPSGLTLKCRLDPRGTRVRVAVVSNLPQEKGAASSTNKESEPTPDASPRSLASVRAPDLPDSTVGESSLTGTSAGTERTKATPAPPQPDR